MERELRGASRPASTSLGPAGGVLRFPEKRFTPVGIPTPGSLRASSGDPRVDRYESCPGGSHTCSRPSIIGGSDLKRTDANPPAIRFPRAKTVGLGFVQETSGSPRPKQLAECVTLPIDLPLHSKLRWTGRIQKTALRVCSGTMRRRGGFPLLSKAQGVRLPARRGAPAARCTLTAVSKRVRICVKQADWERTYK